MSLVSIIVAAAENNVIGKNNDLLWHLPEDLRFFKHSTTGHTVIMGRKTYESVGKPLPNRRNIIITRQPDYLAAGAEIVNSLHEALAISPDREEVFIIGGAEIYRQALPITDKLYLTRVHAVFEGDAFFPEIDGEAWQLIAADKRQADEKHRYAYSFLTYLKKTDPV